MGIGWRHLTLGAAWLATVAVGGGLGWGCWGDQVGFSPVLARCEPRSTSPDNCPGAYVCCSDDPATSGGSDGEPLFSRSHNDRGRSGMCVETGWFIGLDEPPGCPIPCNPTWLPSYVVYVCDRPEAVCCQTEQLHEDDCVLDPDDGRWRPADGRDALASLEGADRWSPTEDSTHQDPDFSGCEAIAGGDRGSETFRECVGQLTTANQRGYCMDFGPGGRCPIDDGDYVDPCEAMN